jgi:hypothetical protein
MANDGAGMHAPGGVRATITGRMAQAFAASATTIALQCQRVTIVRALDQDSQDAESILM